MYKYNISISGNTKVGSLAVGPGATAIGSVTTGNERPQTTCSHCEAPIKVDRRDCEFCGTAYPEGVGANIGSISISCED